MTTRSLEVSDRLEVYQLALTESRTAFADLMQQPEKIRRNVGALLGFAAVSVTIFGAAPGRNTFVSGCRVGVIIAVLGLAVCTAAVLAPKKLVPSMKADTIVRWADEGDTLEGAVKSLALGTDENYSTNAELIKKMFKWQIAAAVCFGLTAVLLAAPALGS